MSVSISSYHQRFSIAKVGTEEEAYLDEVDFSETFVVPGLLNVKNGNNILVIEVSEQLHLS
jgi:hypothetical protein